MIAIATLLLLFPAAVDALPLPSDPAASSSAQTSSGAGASRMLFFNQIADAFSTEFPPSPPPPSPPAPPLAPPAPPALPLHKVERTFQTIGGFITSLATTVLDIMKQIVHAIVNTIVPAIENINPFLPAWDRKSPPPSMPPMPPMSPMPPFSPPLPPFSPPEAVNNLNVSFVLELYLNDVLPFLQAMKTLLNRPTDPDELWYGKSTGEIVATGLLDLYDDVTEASDKVESQKEELDDAVDLLEESVDSLYER